MYDKLLKKCVNKAEKCMKIKELRDFLGCQKILVASLEPFLRIKGPRKNDNVA